jgi:hypothetical protein
MELLSGALQKGTPIRCILVSGTKKTGTKYSPRPELVGRVTMATLMPGKGIEIVFRKR